MKPLTKTNKLILGTVQFGLDYGINNTTGKISRDEAFQIISYAKEAGIYAFDTAASYGTSEEIIGEYLLKTKDDLKIITKFDLKTNSSLIQSTRESMRRLKTDQLEALFFHSYHDYLQCSEHLDGLRSENVKYNDLGVSVYTNEEAEAVIEDKNITCIQLPFNLLDNEFLRKETLLKVKQSDKKIQTRSVFLQGLFYMETNKIPSRLAPLKKYLDKIHLIAKQSDMPVAALALQYVLSKSYIDHVLIGVDSLDQLKINLGMLPQLPDPYVFDEIDSIHVTQRELLNPSLWNL